MPTGQRLMRNGSAEAPPGKTSTLKLLAENSGKNGFYFAFNKSIANEVKKSMPRSVKTGTVHSFAYRWAISSYKPEKLINKPSFRDVRRHIEGMDIPSIDNFKLSMILLQTIARFCQSDMEVFSYHNIPINIKGFKQELCALAPDYKKFIKAAEDMWHEMTDPNSPIPLGHDGYLKLWSQSGQKLLAEYILIDEAQDLNPVMLKIIEEFDGQKVLVGDGFQQIYSWRGAINAMSINLHCDDMFLTKTFRFGNTLAMQANSVLNLLNAEKYIEASGEKKHLKSQPRITVNAHLFRKNENLLEEAYTLHKKDMKYYINDPGNNLLWAVEDFFRLQKGQYGRSQTFQGFNSWKQVLTISQNDDHSSLRGFVKLFDRFDPEGILVALKAAEQFEDKTYATLSTVHQSKGLEWGVVRLQDDFNLNYGVVDFSEQYDELRLLYVAITRAQDLIQTSGNLNDFLKTHCPIN
jgi:hypothetical protein